MKLRFFISSLFIVIQIALIIYARFIPERFFCWAPYDIHTKFEVNGNINGEDVGTKELSWRYGYRMQGWEQRSIYNVFSIIKQYETTYGKEDIVEVKVNYSVNGHQEQVWQFKN